jgi:small subunit ribosomal protein S14
MAKESMKAREVKRARLIKKYAEKREKLKKEGKWDELQLLPKNSVRFELVTAVNLPVDRVVI